MALRLTLKPNERAILGGAVLTNGKHRAELFVETEVPVLRGSDILSPSMVRTPCERIVLAIQLMYVDPQRRSAHEQTYRTLVDDVLDASPTSRAGSNRSRRASRRASTTGAEARQAAALLSKGTALRCSLRTTRIRVRTKAAPSAANWKRRPSTRPHGSSNSAAGLGHSDRPPARRSPALQPAPLDVLPGRVDGGGLPPPAALRANLLQLSAFVDRRTFEMMSKPTAEGLQSPDRDQPADRRRPRPPWGVETTARAA